jgi:hypothetical protein
MEFSEPLCFGVFVAKNRETATKTQSHKVDTKIT